MTKERPILFSAPMVRALLAGTKTQTRRIVAPGRRQDWLSTEVLLESPRAKPCIMDGEQWAQFAHPLAGQTVGGIVHDEWSPLTCIRCPYGVPGDRLWVREAWRAPLAYELTPPRKIPSGTPMVYNADGAGSLPHLNAGKLRPGMFMPRWASRIMLEVTEVRVERLQDISEADAIAEGTSGGHGAIPGYPYAASAVEHYRWLWDSINGPGAWAANPWVWAVSFSMCLPGVAK